MLFAYMVLSVSNWKYYMLKLNHSRTSFTYWFLLLLCAVSYNQYQVLACLLSVLAPKMERLLVAYLYHAVANIKTNRTCTGFHSSLSRALINAHTLPEE